jgi:hypothetical protein
MAIALAACVSGSAQTIPLPDLPETQKHELIAYLTENWISPEDYVMSKFKDRDIVFLGEFHRIKHDVELVHNLIPRLHANGVYDLGIEFGCSEYQDTVDYLINAPVYDEELARWLLFKSFSSWAFVEYEDIYRRAWELNRTLDPSVPRFRVVHLQYRQRWDLATIEMAKDDVAKVWYRGTGDSVMARVVLDEFVKKGRKALIYCGMHHAFTRYRQPRVDESTGEFKEYGMRRLGNIVSDSIPSRVFSISLHSPWMQRRDLNAQSYPVGGVIDAAMREFHSPRVGFDAGGSPFGLLTDTAAYYSAGYSPFVLADFCDGYIYQKYISDYEGCTVDTLFVTWSNFHEAVKFIPNVAARPFFKSPADFIGSARDDTNFKQRFRLMH